MALRIGNGSAKDYSPTGRIRRRVDSPSVDGVVVNVVNESRQRMNLEGGACEYHPIRNCRGGENERSSVRSEGAESHPQGKQVVGPRR